MPNDSLHRDLEATLKARLDGEVRFDTFSRVLYSTDASNYQIEPVGVVIPRTVEDVVRTVETAAQHNVAILPRGGGTMRPWNEHLRRRRGSHGSSCA